MDYGVDDACDRDLEAGRACCSYQESEGIPGSGGCETCVPLVNGQCPPTNNEGGGGVIL